MRILKKPVVLAVFASLAWVTPARPADAMDVNAVLDKAVKALGGETNLAKAHAVSWKTKGKLTFDGNDNPFNGQTTLADLQHARMEFDGEFGGNEIRGVTLLDGDTGWRDIAGNRMDLDRDTIASERRNLYLQLLPALVLPLKDKAMGFKVEAAPGEKVGDKTLVNLKVTPPDGKEFTLSFDETSGLPFRTIARVLDFGGNEYIQEVLFLDYKEMSGIQKATRLHFKREGQKFMDVQLVEFKLLDKVELKKTAD